jgi:glutamyl-tRNA synthetase
MPQWAHLPLILGPTGKLSKRDGAKYGFPVFAMNWTDPKTKEHIEGFKEKGFMPEAFVNLLAVLGWNDGTEQEIFSLPELIGKFSMDRVHKGGAKFDFEKAKWFNHEWIKKLDPSHFSIPVKSLFESNSILIKDDIYFNKVMELVKDRCTLLPDFYDQASYFFKAPSNWDIDAVKPKWNDAKTAFFNEYSIKLEAIENWEIEMFETVFKELAAEKNIKPGELQLPMRIMLVGGKFGPAVFEIAAMIGKDETINRIKKALSIFNA